LRARIESGNLTHGAGSYSQYNIAPEYIARIVADINYPSRSTSRWIAVTAWRAISPPICTANWAAR